MLGFRASFTAPPRLGSVLPPVRVAFPDGSARTTDEPGIEDALSGALDRNVRLA